MSAETETRQPGRRVHWLELFFDLVLVAYIGQIAHTMHGDPSWTDAAVFFALLATAWWAWVNAMVSMNIFGARVTPVIWVAVTVAMISIQSRSDASTGAADPVASPCSVTTPPAGRTRRRGS